MVKEGLFSKETTTIIYLHIAGEVLKVTPEHPFLVNGEWLTADKLTTYNKLTLYDGTTTPIEKIVTEKLATPKKVYNFAVQGYNSYFVGESKVLVHNCEVLFDMKPGQFGPKANVRIFDYKLIKKMSKENLIENIETLKASLNSRKKEFKHFEKKGGDPEKQVGHAQRITIEETYLKSLEKELKSRR